MMTAPTGGPLTGVATIEAILRLAKSVAVFPCRSKDEEIIVEGKPKTLKAKSPLVGNGFLDASRDESTIRAWWKRYPDALVGVPMGQVSGIIAIDYDPAKHTEATGEWFEAHTDALLAARVHTTRSDGRHYVYRVGKNQRYRGGVDLVLSGKKRSGIDLRADGGYIIWWPLHGGTVTNETAPFLPAGLIDERAFNYQGEVPKPRDEPSPQAWQRDRHKVLEALAYVDPAGRDDWLDIGMALHRATGGNDEGFELWHAWSSGGITGQTPHSYSGADDCRYTWASFKNQANRPVTLGTLFHKAKDRGYSPSQQRNDDSDRYPPMEQLAASEPDAPSAPEAAAQDKTETQSYRQPMRWAQLEEQKPPERIWRLSHWLSVGPTLFAGRGGIGKTLVAQTLATALCVAQNYIDQIDDPIVVLMWACEDEHDELWRRQVAICDYFGIKLSALEGRLILEPRLGCENTLFSPVFGKPTWTPLRDELRSQVEDYRADLLIADNTSQLFGCNENDRHHVTSFVNGLVGLNRSRPFSQLILSHPAKAADSEFSGSTAWENSVRMRWFMGAALPDQEEPEEGAEDPNVRFIAKRKTNYSVKDFRKMIFDAGVFKPESQPGTLSQRYNYAARQEGAVAAVLSAIRKFNERGIRVVAAKNSPDSVVRKMRESKLHQDFTPKELAEAVVGLQLQGRISETKVGNFQNRTAKMGLTPCSK